MHWQPGQLAAARGALLLAFVLHHWSALATMPSNAKFYTIHWNSSNPIFRIDNTDNIIDVNRNNMKFEYDQVNLICPVYMPGTRDEEMEKYIIYNVSKDEYETCRITNPNPRIIAVCDKPYKLMYFTITFRPFTPQPGGLEFLPGHDYYFISTSTSDDLHRRIGGRCTTHNMKIVFKVWGPSTEAPPSTSPSPTPAFVPAPPPPMPSRPPVVTWWGEPSQRPPPPTEAPPTPPAPPTTKKSKPYGGKHPNEVVKSEELTLGGAPAIQRASVLLVCAIAVFMPMLLR
ncbi:unnamed protein product [Callosobruchus maculatus]|uniref:Ephrin RBD domain-containing protein n=1 Tax=Callosobruchus maculatus TaxID=64391 RepID=A0A653BN58_CALMS|nr:unnamed protein product [Callosobruchus maculatus]